MVAMTACAGEGGDEGGRSVRAWLPDTATVLYTAAPDGDADLFVRRGRGGTPKNLTAHAGQDHWGSWSPDGSRIAFQTLRDGNREVYVADADGSNPVNLTRHESEDLLPEWSPDGTRILFFSSRGVPRGPNGELAGNLWLMDADGGNARRLTRTPLTSTFGGAWAPDGRSIIFSRRGTDGDVDLQVIDVETGLERVLLERAGGDGGGRYAPDGARIVFNAQFGDVARIALVGADGRDLRFLTDGGQHYNPMWSPNGRWILFSGAPLGETRMDLLVVSVDGGPVAPLVADAGDERLGRWARPGQPR